MGPRLAFGASGDPGDCRGKEDPMEPVLPDTPVDESEFDLDVRLQPIARDASDELKPSEDCPQDTAGFVCTEALGADIVARGPARSC
jgi:hypothetical protein